MGQSAGRSVAAAFDSSLFTDFEFDAAAVPDQTELQATVRTWGAFPMVALGEGFCFFFLGLMIAFRIWFTKVRDWLTRPIDLPQWSFVVGAFVIAVGVLSAQHLLMIDFTDVNIALAKAARVE